MKPERTTYLQLPQVSICVIYAANQNKWLLLEELVSN